MLTFRSKQITDAMGTILADLVNRGLVELEWDSKKHTFSFKLSQKGFEALREEEVLKELGVVQAQE